MFNTASLNKVAKLHMIAKMGKYGVEFVFTILNTTIMHSTDSDNCFGWEQ